MHRKSVTKTIARINFFLFFVRCAQIRALAQMQEVENGLCELIVAAKKGDLDSALLLLSDLEFCDGHGKNAVMHALENRHLDLAERLIRHALSLPQSRCLVHVSVFGRSPLHFACAAGQKANLFLLPF